MRVVKTPNGRKISLRLSLLSFIASNRIQNALHQLFCLSYQISLPMHLPNFPLSSLMQDCSMYLSSLFFLFSSPLLLFNNSFLVSFPSPSLLPLLLISLHFLLSLSPPLLLPSNRNPTNTTSISHPPSPRTLTIALTFLHWITSFHVSINHTNQTLPSFNSTSIYSLLLFAPHILLPFVTSICSHSLSSASSLSIHKMKRNNIRSCITSLTVSP